MRIYAVNVVRPLRNIQQRLLTDSIFVGQVIPIDMLPDGVLLEIFGFYMDGHQETMEGIQTGIHAWQTLVHVCRQWRNIVFASPRCLNLRLVLTPGRPARDTLDVWPALLLLIQGRVSTSNVDNIITGLERSDRVCKIDLDFPSSQLEQVSAAMQVSFPELTDLQLWTYETTSEFVLPDSFLGGSAPRLRYLQLRGIPFPVLPKLLLSATHLVHLHLYHIPHSGYISPEAVVSGLSALNSLEDLRLNFESPRSCPDLEKRLPPPSIRSVLLALSRFGFKGASEYLEDLVARIDAPRLCDLGITFFHSLDFDTPQIVRFISRTPRLKTPDEARVVFQDSAVRVRFPSQTSRHRGLDVAISCSMSDWQLSSLEQVCTSSLPPLFTVENLYIYEHRHLRPHWQDDIENKLWLELLYPFTAVKNLYISKQFTPCIAPALQELILGRMMGQLPILQNIFLEGLEPSGPVQEGIRRFVAARQSSGHPIAVSLWDRDLEQDGS